MVSAGLKQSMNTQTSCTVSPAAPAAGYHEVNTPLFWGFKPLQDLMSGAAGTRGRLSPPLEVHESGENLVVQLDLPGVSKENLDISLEDGVLAVSGNRTPSTGQALYTERSFGAFRRSINLPSAIDGNKVQAIYENGVLVITLPKAEEAKAKKIMVS